MLLEGTIVFFPEYFFSLKRSSSFWDNKTLPQKTQAAHTLFVIYIRDGIALRFEPFKRMYENGKQTGLRYFAKRNETKRNEMVLCEMVLCEMINCKLLNNAI